MYRGINQFNDFELTKTSRIIINCFVAFGFALPIGLGLYDQLTGPGGKELIILNASKEVFKGKVDSIYRDQRNHNVEMAVLSNGYLYPIWSEWERKIETGDPLSKKAGTLIVELHKRNGDRITLNYNDVFKDFK